MKANKLLKYNLGKTLNERIELSKIEIRRALIPLRQSNALLMAAIHAEVDPKIANENRLWDECDGRTRGLIFQGYTNEKGSNSPTFHPVLGYHAIGYMEPELASANSLGHRILTHTVELKDSELLGVDKATMKYGKIPIEVQE